MQRANYFILYMLFIYVIINYLMHNACLININGIYNIISNI